MIYRGRMALSATAALLACLWFARPASAEAARSGYIAGGAGIYSNRATSGGVREIQGGGEAILDGVVGIGGDAALLIGGGDALVPLAATVSGHVRGASSFDPFVRGGYTRFVALTERDGDNAINLGGGFNYWFTATRAWIVEVRVVVPQRVSRYWTIVAGIGFK